uniref:Uncharacterized protein n=1 Tax=Nelumbo nucifera TaxID=4432 RepID=A0A822XC16_NELNU|nr:TPA_asm: hypothetical protein HUJ06_020417 [Nelumbo nucifera]
MYVHLWDLRGMCINARQANLMEAKAIETKVYGIGSKSGYDTMSTRTHSKNDDLDFVLLFLCNLDVFKGCLV